MVVKPINIEDFDDTLDIEKECCVKYFEVGETVIITEGRYKGEGGMVMSIDDENIATPLIKLTSSQIEVRLKTQCLRLRSQRDIDNALKASHEKSDYKVGDLVTYNQGQVFGYVIGVDREMVKMVNDRGKIIQVKGQAIDKKLPTDKRKIIHDSMNNGCQIDDTVFVSNK